MESGDGSEADRRPGTPGADQNPISSGINILIRALTAQNEILRVAVSFLQGILIYS